MTDVPETRAATVPAGPPARVGSARGSWRDRRPEAGFSAIVLGLALLAGAVAAAVNSGGVWSAAVPVVGLSVALAVLAVGIIVLGIRGKQSGAVAGFAFLAVMALVFVGLFPAGTQFFLVGAPTWPVSADAADAPPGYAVLSGRATIDLSALDAAAAEARTIDVWMGVGVTELVLPGTRSVRVEASTLAGGIDYAGEGAAVQQGGVFFHDARTVNPGDAPPVARIRVWTLLGQVSVVSAAPGSP